MMKKMSFFLLSPEASGVIGHRSRFDRENPGRIEHLHFVFEGWMGDHLLGAPPAFVVSSELRYAIEGSGLTGCEFAVAEIEKSEQFTTDKGNMPSFHWIITKGIPYMDDFALSEDNHLVVSERALDIIRKFPLENCDIDDASKAPTFEERKRRIYAATFKKLGIEPPKPL